MDKQTERNTLTKIPMNKSTKNSTDTSKKPTNKPTTKITNPTEYATDDSNEQVDDKFSGDNKETEK